ncbi:outer membrane biogenesis lipoprotein LolB [Variovorax boronicumulans]|uniref:Outer membrane biogenesis lipoprotein LolB n=1 Tax=Variovorax boronicumulans TaxID=436515 RepID=A0AAW8D339_9BURK|nr:hypothetical protein [Variovorax boronicumulans]MDP9897204.1 outer membrane biogenesis lipoprotein LolB [Variovorax boronicumulans]MDQ0011997.1 outer membrane biogenesis lipoprotein LolB [Variovorax boronicumulans]MDQ0057245.1 outer membrane biogenesis lipoprotein LolB [Variovorax boronicumulans]
MRRAALTLFALASGALLLAACTEKPQTNAEGVKHDAVPWSGTGTQANTGTVFTAPGWKVGDKTAWEQQIKLRSNGQNEYTREN